MSEITSESLLAAIKTVGVLGAGQMGAGIAQVAAQTGYDVLLADVSQQRADAGKAGIIKQLGRLVEKGKLAADERDKIGGRITAVVGAAGLTPGDFLIEAATENIDLKKKLFQELDQAARPGWCWRPTRARSASRCWRRPRAGRTTWSACTS
jgi:3-hydroxybutyryl-CoA dehydrogenase